MPKGVLNTKGARRKTTKLQHKAELCLKLAAAIAAETHTWSTLQKPLLMLVWPTDKQRLEHDCS
jgi:hypothetical protein